MNTRSRNRRAERQAKQNRRWDENPRQKKDRPLTGDRPSKAVFFNRREGVDQTPSR